MKKQKTEIYDRASDAIDSWLYRANREARNWRIGFFITLLAFACTAMGVLYLAHRPEFRPYIIEVAKDGSARSVGPLKPKNDYKPSDKSIKYFLAEFIKNLRSVPRDSIVLVQNLDKASFFVTSKARHTYFDSVNSNAKPKFDANKTVSLDILSIIKRSDDSYLVNWSEETFSENGFLLDKQKFAGLFTVSIQPPVEQDALNNNPLGIIIEYFNVSKEVREAI